MFFVVASLLVAEVELLGDRLIGCLAFPCVNRSKLMRSAPIQF